MISVRPAGRDDVPHVLRMVRAISDLHQAWDRERFGLRGDPAVSYARWLPDRCDDPRSVFLVAETDGPARALVGYLVGTVEAEIPIYWMPECGWIHDLWVDEPYRNEGLGRQMTTLAIERFARIGVKQLRLQTALANDVSRQLFASCGFRPATTEMLMSLEKDSVPERHVGTEGERASG
jgi:GNAT superfamily N-acetyltransferase